jgi:hypothetical protein
MKAAHLLTFLGLFVFSLNAVNAIENTPMTPSDAEIQHKIVGTWIVDTQSANGFTIKGTVTFYANGNFVSEATVVLGKDSEHIAYEGKWQVDGGKLIETITKSNTKNISVGKISRDKVISIRENELVYQTESGKTVKRQRGK